MLRVLVLYVDMAFASRLAHWPPFYKSIHLAKKLNLRWCRSLNGLSSVASNKNCRMIFTAASRPVSSTRSESKNLDIPIEKKSKVQLNELNRLLGIAKPEKYRITGK